MPHISLAVRTPMFYQLLLTFYIGLYIHRQHVCKLIPLQRLPRGLQQPQIDDLVYAPAHASPYVIPLTPSRSKRKAAARRLNQRTPTHL
ncbi:hypothetical protein K458DRAFT_417123 [Lentithecium fluviatile CBS 122367]|uniref:Uncharacterized protein n=1 Tax=Lentithecium fluviatile CBS 122367 TaxID=1168545 RepID=A0A6G1J6V0_9PLEO|nr:hypothetical protein K458DRAFT_417123 [Lentithecium fluviatile CBS 122367]